MAEKEQKQDAAAFSAQTFMLNLVAGGCAGTSVDVALYPLDTLRTRLQSADGFWKSGGFRGVYRGLLAAALGSAPGAAAFFSTYDTLKRVQNSSGDNEHWTQHAAASSCAEVAACGVRVPTNVVTQNMQVGRYATFSEALRGTFANGGIRGFYVGYGTTVAREIPFAFIQFPLYEGFKQRWAAYQGEPASATQGAACGSLSGGIAGAITTPLDVAKTRIMLEKPVEGQPRKYTGTVSALKMVATEEGVPGLFKGVGPRVMWITIGGFIFFGAYEHSKDALSSTGLF